MSDRDSGFNFRRKSETVYIDWVELKTGKIPKMGNFNGVELSLQTEHSDIW